MVTFKKTFFYELFHLLLINLSHVGYKVKKI